MKRNFAGTSLAVVLVALVALKHAALGFCLCDHQFFLTDCACDDPQVTESCCASGETPATPCDDCVVTVTIDVNDFLWAADSFNPKAQPTVDLDLPSTPFADFTRGTDLASTAMPIRGSPPGIPPLYFLNSVLRL